MMRVSPSLESRVVGGIVGLAIGDAPGYLTPLALRWLANAVVLAGWGAWLLTRSP